MLNRLLFLIFLASVAWVGASSSFAQGADNRGSIIPRGEEKEDQPKSFKETLVKLRIYKEKKEFGEMLERGEEALKLSEELETAFAHNGRLNAQEINKLIAVEKLVKKIRNELGGDDDGWEDRKEGSSNSSRVSPMAQAEAVKSFRSTTLKLFEELKKTTRFSVSAAAIQTSNAVLRLARLLRISR